MTSYNQQRYLHVLKEKEHLHSCRLVQAILWSILMLQLICFVLGLKVLRLNLTELQFLEVCVGGGVSNGFVWGPLTKVENFEGPHTNLMLI